MNIKVTMYYKPYRGMSEKEAEPVDLCRTKPVRYARTEGLMTLEFME
ncbi:MAG TPA: hypothetical protein VJN43_07275 [Bryobacteraceae bacterium]|nr:hypothetical protein [Bryobacteraceae bacterium]